jgi:hypothetical protein
MNGVTGNDRQRYRLVAAVLIAIIFVGSRQGRPLGLKVSGSLWPDGNRDVRLAT